MSDHKIKSSAKDPSPYRNLEALDDPSILTMVFHPRKDTKPWRDDPNIQDTLFPVEEGVMVGARFYISKQRDPIIIYFHGNGEIASDYEEIATLYNRFGMNLLVLDYRGYGRSGGTPSISDMMRDAGALVTGATGMFASREFDGDVYVMGRSLGSASALEVARLFGKLFKGLILESGFADLLALLKRLGVPVNKLPTPQVWAHLNLQAIHEVEVPTLILHGEWDQIIPLSDGRALFENSGALKKELVVIPRAGHNDLLWLGMDQYMDAVCRFVKGKTAGR